jgi:beta-N-acetylhexosaminidase
MKTAVVAVALAVVSCAPTPRPAAPVPDDRWVTQTLRTLTLEEKAGQLIVPVFRGYLAHPDSPVAQKLEGLVRDLGVGGLILSRGDPLEVVGLLNRLQRMAKVPLLVSADLEWGAGIQVPHGATLLPYLMAVGAAGSEELAKAHGLYTAREGRALGIHMTYAPVVDVNVNPENPIINIRSYGEDPAAVARLGAAFIRGARAGGLLTVAKHFPGHGDTALDSHRELAVVGGDRARLDSVELAPFRAAIAAGVDAVMVGHLAVPAVDPSGVAATVSRPVVTDLLRGELGFRGLVVTDAMDMKGITDSLPPGEAAVRALEAGQDLILMSPDPVAARDAIVAAVRSGRLPETRIDESVARVLAAKARAGLHRARTSDPERVWTEIGDPVALDPMRELADRSITLVRNEGGVLPLARTAKALHVTLSGDAATEGQGSVVEAEVKRRVPSAETLVVDSRSSAEELAEAIEGARASEAIIVSAFVRVRAYKGTAAMPDRLSAFLTDLTALGKPLVVVSYGSPYLIRQFPGVPAYLCAYGHSPLSQRAAMKAVFGELETYGHLPVTIPGMYERGHGLRIGRQVARDRLVSTPENRAEHPRILLRSR